MQDKWFELNRRRWDEMAALHPGTAFYGVDRFRAGEDMLLPIELGEMGDVAGRSLLHLQCHFGLDTLSWARKGAAVTGLDFSAEAVRQARKLAAETGLAARFVEANVYDAVAAVGGRFDIVYVTWGALIWLPDLARWARVVAELLAPGGHLYLLEGHPAALLWEQKAADAPILPAFPYFQGGEPLLFRTDKSYADGVPMSEGETAEWQHPLSEILTAILDAGLRLEFFHEHDALAWQLFPCMTEGADRMWRLPPDHPSLPMAFSLRARKP